MKNVDYESEIWADHDEDCYGALEDCIESGDGTYDEGAVWSCCSKSGAAAYCVSSRHKPEPDVQRSAKLLRNKIR